MSEHYYSEKPSVQSNKQTWSFTLRNKSYTFTSDSGVFSKKEVDFGSRVLIEAFQEPETDGDFLDVGCGYGPIGLSLAGEFTDRTVHMVDVNERAVELSNENAEKNEINNVRIYQSDLFSNIDSAQTFASIITNPPIRAGKKVVHAIFEKSAEHLRTSGELWIVIQKKQGGPSAIEKLKELFDEVSVVQKKKGYYIIKAKKV
ncbi:class I SAM-dependent methyltransferase [Bacillus sp. ISL-51]|uniref:class I SAM-dependent methyltransferase n=1 Tax=Bacteria TaxID=2 RepID=UPI001BE8D737|nr:MULTISPECIES: class I SAM-dependent methyltransferase [Bacteria]MBT2575742.1 class I SAM-dependent methyltransferase [Bacillus sp. ISL-51]MBT2635939.1 class I SAM-dependent methyltransferase [Bacillus sp. ISL-26]MBT2711851.1 class I SAM-dependent methyltransferase [Pseudomonas sp. ISL-88]MBY8914685.1 class I SAM-dependent methyltransferase [Bacillus sp. YC2]